jgi:hypothetical protein
VSEKLIALGNWLAEARQELERELDREAATGPSGEAARHWCSMAIGQLELLRDVASSVLSKVEVALRRRLFSSGARLDKGGHG